MLSCRAFITALLLSDLSEQEEKNSMTANTAELNAQQSILFINNGFNEGKGGDNDSEQER